MKKLGLMAAMSGLLLAGMVSAQNVDPNSELGQFRNLRAAGMTAFDGNDLAGAARNFAAAGDILPDSPSILLLKAQLALKQKRKADAKAALNDYLSRGYVLDLARTPEFNAVWDSDLENLLQESESPVGDMHVTATLPGFTLTDAVAYAPDSQQLFLSHIRSGKITALTAAGTRDVVTFRPGVAAYGLGLRDG
ncbi:MAG: tetratricopeptide repeat protein, partial [Asticcacaulis sp.]|nr:tetratricopeptide repeat protein [Asticcacaulis sp.]